MAKERYGVDKMDELFNVTVDTYIKAVNCAEEPVLNGEGAVVGSRFNASILAAAAKFLKDNGIVSQVTKDSKIGHLAKTLAPFQPDPDGMSH